MAHTKADAIGIHVHLNTDIETAQARTTEALKTEGFGVLTEIDVKETMKKKLDISVDPYKILGACNPVLAHQALTIAPEVGLLLPCNVTIRQLADGTCDVALIDPLVMLGVIAHPDLKVVAEEARARLERVAAALETYQ